MSAQRTHRDVYHGNGRTCGEAQDDDGDEEHSHAHGEVEHMTGMGVLASQQLWQIHSHSSVMSELNAHGNRMEYSHEHGHICA